MKLARILTSSGAQPAIFEEGNWAVIEDMFARPFQRTGEVIPAEEATLLAPCEPRVVLGMAHNTGPEDRKIPPQAFMKSARCVVGPGDPIFLDSAHGRVYGEGELTIVVGKECRNLSPDEVSEAILGFTIGNDVTNVDQIAVDNKFTQVKNGDGYTPLGPCIDTDTDFLHAPIVVEKDGSEVARASSADLAWNVIEIMCYLTSFLTLGPGDVVLTGAPFTSLELTEGMKVSITIEGIGTLSNPVQLAS